MNRRGLVPLSWLVLSALALSAAGLAEELRLGTEFQVHSYTTGPQSVPSVAAGADGDFVVVWQSYEQDGSHYGVFGRRFSKAGAPLATEFQVPAYVTSVQSQPRVAAQASGDFVVVWQSSGQDGSSSGIFARRFSSDGNFLGAEFQVNSSTYSHQSIPSIAAGADGDFVVVWQVSVGGDIMARLFSSSGAPLGGEFLVNTYPGEASAPAVAVQADGDFMVVWEGYDVDREIFARAFSSSGAALALEQRVNDFTVEDRVRPAVAAQSDGDFVIAWESWKGYGAYGIFARRVSSAGSPIGTEVFVASHTTPDLMYPSVAARADGAFTVVWSGNADGPSIEVFARRFSSLGAPLAAEVQINTYTVDAQRMPSVTMNPDGDTVIAWESLGQDGSNRGVFAQRFGRAKILDIDGDNEVGPLTDGVLVLRYLFGFTGTTLVGAAVDAAACTRCDATAIEAYLAGLV